MMRTFVSQRGETINVNRVLAKRNTDGLLNDQEAMTLFLNQRAHNNNRNQVLDSSRILKRDLESAKEHDERARLMFLYEQAHNNNVNQVVDPSDGSFNKRQLAKRDLSDSWASKMFLYQKDHNNNLPVVRAKRATKQDSNAKAMFLYQQAHNNNLNQVIDSTVQNVRHKRGAHLADHEARRLFLLQKGHNNNMNQVFDPTVNNIRPHHVSKRDTFQDLLAKQIFASRLAPNNNRRFKRETESDMLATRMFLLQKAHNNNQILVDDQRRLVKRDAERTPLNDEAVNQLFLNQKAHNNNQNQVYDASASNLNEDDQMGHRRVKRQLVNDPNQSNQVIHKVDGPIKADPHKEQEKEHHDEHAHASNSLKSSHSAIGVTLVLGFVFMLIVDQIGGKFSHRHAPSLDAQSIRSKISFVTTLGLVVHAAGRLA